MSWIIEKDGNVEGLFIHVPKCGGSSSAKMFRDNGYTLIRPSKEYIGHLTLRETLNIVKKEYSPEQINSWKVYICFRESISWIESFFRYSIEYGPEKHGSVWEHNNFSKIGILQYMKMMTNHILYDEPIAKELNSLLYKRLSSYLSVDEDDAGDFLDMEIVLYTNKSMDKLLKDVVGEQSEYSVPKINATTPKEYLNEEIGYDSVKYEYYKEIFNHIHYGEYPSIFKKLFDDGIFKFKVKSILE